MSRRAPVLIGAALLLITVNLRLPIAAVPPLLDDIRADLGMSSAVSGLLTTLPILCFGLAGPAAPVLARRFGSEMVLLGCVLAIAAGTVIRLVAHTGPLFAGTLVIGIGIALANVLSPSVIKRDFARPGTMMGLYTMVLNGGAAVGAGLSVPAASALGDWRWALGVWAVPALLAALLWLPAVLAARRASESGPPVEPGPRISLWGDRLAWLLTGFFGLQSAMFYTIVAWVPDILHDAGHSEAAAGIMLSLYALLGLPTAMVVPVLAARAPGQRRFVVALVAVYLGGLIGLLLSPGTAAVAWMVLLGLAQGAGIGLALTLIVIRARDGEHAAALSGMVQGAGYLIAAAGPVLIGVVHSLTGSWTEPLLVIIATGLALLVCGLGAGRPGMVGAGHERRARWAY